MQPLLLPMSILLFVVLIIHKIMRSRIDSQSLYAFWLVIPLGLVFYLLPLQWQVESSAIAKVVSTFTVTSSQWQSDTNNPLSYWHSVWVMGAIIMLTFAISSYCLFRRRLKLLPLAHNTKQWVKPLMPEKLSVWQSEQVNSPMLVGVFKQVLLLPTDFEQQFNREQQQLILEHEICHFDRNDIYWNLIAYTFVALFWFHPLVWLAYARFCRDQEISCDQNVLARKQTESRINYSKALVQVVNKAPRLSFAQLSFINYGDKNMMLERINNIKLNPRRSTLKAALLSVTAFILVSGVSVASGFVGNSNSDANAMAQSNYKEDAMPIVRIEPKYPIKAAKEGVEGAVLLKFDIALDGSTNNISVLQAVPSDIFNKESIRALAKWKYKPDPQKVLKNNVVQLDYRIDKNSTFKSVNLIEKISVSKK